MELGYGIDKVLHVGTDRGSISLNFGLGVEHQNSLSVRIILNSKWSLQFLGILSKRVLVQENA
jgi:hypothetical protein